MRAVIQRVNQASVTIGDEITGAISNGLLVLLALHQNDTENAISKMADKIISLRIFEDKDGKMNRSVQDIKGELLVVSQFTLYGDCSKGNRPSFIQAADPAKAEEYYEKFVSYLKDKGFRVPTGRFRSYMSVSLINDGPTTIILDI